MESILPWKALPTGEKSITSESLDSERLARSLRAEERDLTELISLE